jgi:hypothetical protein
MVTEDLNAGAIPSNEKKKQKKPFFEPKKERNIVKVYRD